MSYPIGAYTLRVGALLAPMAGITDAPLRALCREFGAALTTSEMLASNPALRHSRKSSLRRPSAGEPRPRVVQIAGADPAEMADAARYNVEQGADVIDINMGCPARKVCSRQAGSALLADEALVARILESVVAAVPVPVTLKFRTGPDPSRRNALRIAAMAERAGIAALVLHGRTRADAYRGQAEYRTIRQVKAASALPVVANGDIDSPAAALRVLEETGADAVMIGRGAQGRPWLFRRIAEVLAHGRDPGDPEPDRKAAVALAHVEALHRHYGAAQGVRVARKHIGWYLADWPNGDRARRQLVTLDSAAQQLEALAEFLHTAARRAA